MKCRSKDDIYRERERLLIVTSPSGLWSILSMPLGPRDVRRIRATAFPAEMLAFWASKPRNRVFWSCSFRMMNGRPNSSKANAIFYLLLLLSSSLCNVPNTRDAGRDGGGNNIERKEKSSREWEWVQQQVLEKKEVLKSSKERSPSLLAWICCF